MKTAEQQLADIYRSVDEMEAAYHEWTLRALEEQFLGSVMAESRKAEQAEAQARVDAMKEALREA